MQFPPRIAAALILILAASILATLAQDFSGRGRDRERNRRSSEGGWRQRAYEREARRGIPTWERNQEMPEDVFTFARVRYTSYNDWGWRRRGGKWRTDYPDSDLNFSYRLQQLTSLEVDPNGTIVRLTDPELYDYPMIYMIEPGDIALEPEERNHLRSYLLNGGFLLVDDFWGTYEYEVFYDEIKKVFPEREPQELPIEHEIFHCVFDLKEKPQLPSIGHAFSGLTYEAEKPGSEEVHYKALFDDDGRMMAIICHNTDLGDGWEREGEDPWYFRNFSEPKAYPMGINIIFYAMTH